MRLIIILITAGFLHVSAAGFAQKITLNEKNAKLTEVIKHIRIQSGYQFVYRNDLLENTANITIHLKDATLQEALKQALKDAPFTYEISDGTVVIQPKEETVVDKIKKLISTIDVTGRIVDQNNQPLPGATVKTKDGLITTSTDGNGSFILKGVQPNTVIVISFIGYDKKEIIASANPGNIKLDQASSKLDEVKVIAYGNTTQRLSVGNISTLSAKDINDIPVSNPLLALEGKIPGVSITQVTGFANSTINIQIQGKNSLFKGNEAFYVIDGVPYPAQLPYTGVSTVFGLPDAGLGRAPGNPLSFINPDDIESISVLKDATATAIYGSQASNGAILITRKKGKAGELRFNADLQNGWSSVGHFMDLMNTPQYLQMRYEALANDGTPKNSPSYTTAVDINGFWDPSRNTDWQKTLIGGTAKYQKFNGSLSGGTANTQYLLSGTYGRQTTVFPGDFADQKSGIHFSLTSASTDQKIKLTFSGSYQYDNNRLSSYDPTSAAISLPPDAPALYKADGSLNWMVDGSGTSTWLNPVAQFKSLYNVNTKNLIGNAILSYEIISGLILKGNFGYNNLLSDELLTGPLSIRPPEQQPNGFRVGSFGNSSTSTWIAEPQLTYIKVYGKHTLNALVGTTFQQNNLKALSYFGLGYNSDQVIPDIHSAANVLVTNSQVSVSKYDALFARLNYNYDEKYLFDATIRRDGSSRFGTANRFHSFGALGAGWAFSKEKIISDNVHFLSFGKLRISYGTTGNNNIGDYQSLSLYSPLAAGVPYQNAIGLIPGGLPNPYLQWEETKKLNTGVDLGFFQDRILMTINYFRNDSSNQLLGYDLPTSTGFSNITRNFPATVENSGLELSLNTVNIKGGEFQWTSNFNISLPKNKLVSFPNLATSSYASLLIIGKPVSLVRLVHYLGVDPATGQYIFSDKNGNTTSNPDLANDATVLRNPSPTVIGGFQNTFKYKQLSLDLFFQFTRQYGLNYKFGSIPGRALYNQPATVLDRWQQPGDVALYQRYNDNFGLVAGGLAAANNSDAAYGDASYLRLKNASISWALPQKIATSLKLRNASIYAQGQNLWTLTNYVGLDPETMSIYALPPLRTFVLGLKVRL